MNFKNKHCLITGGTQSIGKAIAEDLHALGAKVIITGRKPEDVGAVIAKGIGPQLSLCAIGCGC